MSGVLFRQSPGFELSKEKFINVTNKSFYTDGPKVKFGIAQEECAEPTLNDKGKIEFHVQFAASPERFAQLEQRFRIMIS